MPNDFTAPENGYVQVFVANEHNQPVWFDNLEVTYKEAMSVQENHYSPWGLNLAGIEKEGSPDHKWQYIGREKQSELGLNWLDLKLRMYDPQLGRFHAVDPRPDEADQESLSPYQYGLNNPVLQSDPDGDCPICPFLIAGIKEAAQEYGTQVAVNLAQGKSLGDALTDVDGGEIAKAGVIGAVTLGAGTLLGTVSKVAKIANALDNAGDAAKAADKAGDAAKSVWKGKIVGTAQKTGTPGHQVKTYREAIKAAKDPKVEKVYLNRSYKTSIPKGKSGERPDVLIKNKDGRVDAVEVASKTDDEGKLLRRNQAAMQNLPAENRGGTVTIVRPTTGQ